MPQSRSSFVIRGMVGAMAVGTMLLAITRTAHAELIYGVTSQDFLVTWDSAQPTSLLSGIAISGLQLNERLVGIDIRPATGQLYGLGSSSRLYTIDPSTGVAALVGGPGPFSPLLNGANFGFDFNPTVDRIRVVSNASQNLRLHPVTGAVVAVDGALAYAMGDPNFGVSPNVAAAAYTNNFPGAMSTVLYGIDPGVDALVIQNPPNNGTLNTVGTLGLDVTDILGFDISGASGIAYAVLFNTASNRSMFATINLATGAAAEIGEIDGGTTITGITVIPEPATLWLVGAAWWAVMRRRVR